MKKSSSNIFSYFIVPILRAREFSKRIFNSRSISILPPTAYALPPSRSGFTVVELLIVVAVSITITSLILSNQGRFKRTLDLTNLAYETAFAIREAQVYGTSVRGAGGNFEAGYGIHFNVSMPDSFFLFRDSSPLPSGIGDGVWNSANDTVLEVYKMRGGIKITEFCTFASPKKHCKVSPQPPPTVITRMDITFQRPDPSAKIEDDCTIGPCGNKPYTKAEITLASSDGVTRTIVILRNGQASVQ
jgi:type II secretory pathway pseudopilin PulG